MKTYLFYDIETTGLSKSFDQVLQFAAIRTDLNLKELKRYELKIKLNPDVIPSPYALMTHKMGIHAIEEGESEYDAIKQIHQWLNEPGTISLGYNTLGFDDEFLRFSFYRHLLTPYTHQFANQCSRMDIYPMAVMYHLFKPHVIEWPQKNGMLSLKLEEINAANQFISGRSHDAMIDVEVTLELARRFRQEREMWDYLHGYFNKQIDTQRTQPLQNQIALLVDGIFGSADKFQCPAIFLGNHRHYTNQSVWMRLDLGTLRETTPENVAITTRVNEKKPGTKNKKSGEPSFILPLSKHQLTDERIMSAKQNYEWLTHHPEITRCIMDHYLDYTYPDYPEADHQTTLYQSGFWSRDEEFFANRFHAVTPVEKSNLLKPTLTPRTYALALRILGRYFPETLTPAQREEFNAYLAKSYINDPTKAAIDYQGRPRMTPFAALNDIQKIRENPISPPDEALLNELEQYLRGK